MEPRNEKNFNSNLLFVSIMFHQADCCLWLCSEFKRRGFDLDQQNSRQLSALHMAAKFGSLHCLQILVSSGANIHLLDDTGRNAAQIAHESGQKLILGYLALAESCFQLAQQLLKIKNIPKPDQSTQTETAEETSLKTESSKIKGSPAKPILENRLRPVEINLNQSEPTKSDQSEDEESDQSDTEVSKILNSTENENKPSEHPCEHPSEHFNVEFDQRPCSANYLYAESVLSDVPNCSTEYWRTFMDQSSLRGSVFPASIAGSELDLGRGFMTSPTVSNCTNEPQIESKEKMRQRMAKVSLALKGSPKVVSPKRTLGSGPVLVGKLETVAEKELETTQLETSLSNSGRDSIQANSIHSGHSRNKSLNTSLSQTNSQSTTSKSPAGSLQAANNSMNNSIGHQHE